MLRLSDIGVISDYDVTHDDEPKNNYFKKTTKLILFKAFCGVIYRHLLQIWIYIAVSN